MIPVIPIAFMMLRQGTMTAENRVRDSILIPAPYRAAPDDVTVSVIIIAYNEEKRLPATLAALGNQTRPPDTIIVVDNESDDNTVNIALNAGAMVVSYPHHNISAMRNLGSQSCDGDILVFLDADTVPESTTIERIVEEINLGYSLVYTNLVCTDNHVMSLARYTAGIFYGITHHDKPHGGLMAFHRSDFESIRGFDENFVPGEPEDADIGIRTAQQFGSYSIKYLRDVYAGTSARRQEAEGYFSKFNGTYWAEQSIRG